MDSLRPDRDELDQFRKRQSGKKTKAPAAKSSVVKTPGKSGSSVFSSLLIVVCLMTVAALGWLYWQQHNELAALRMELEDASGFIGQSKLLLARLEGEVSETGEELAASGSQVEKKLAFLDSEMRKLWGVSNDRNKKAIQNNDAAIAGLENNLAKLLAEQKKQSLRLSEAQQSLNAKLEEVNRSLRGMDVQVSAASSEVAVTRESMNESLSQLRQKMAELDKAVSAVKLNSSAIASIDTSRQQLNERVVELERQLNDVQLKLGGP